MTAGAFTLLIDELGDGEPNAERVADACARHLGTVKPGDLPADAQPLWREAAQLLKVPADKPVPPKSFAAIKSWPTSRAIELVARIRRIRMILDQRENERLEDEIRDRIRRHYL